MTGALLAIAIFAALLALWAWSLCRIAAISDRRIPPPPATDGTPPRNGVGGRATPLVPPAPAGADWRPLLDLMHEEDEPRFTRHRRAHGARLNAARSDSHSGRVA